MSLSNRVKRLEELAGQANGPGELPDGVFWDPEFVELFI